MAISCFESRSVLKPTRARTAGEHRGLQADYLSHWLGLKKHFDPAQGRDKFRPWTRHTNPKIRSWLPIRESQAGCAFPVQNLPFCRVSGGAQSAGKAFAGGVAPWRSESLTCAHSRMLPIVSPMMPRRGVFCGQSLIR